MLVACDSPLGGIPCAEPIGSSKNAIAVVAPLPQMRRFIVSLLQRRKEHGTSAATCEQVDEEINVLKIIFVYYNIILKLSSFYILYEK